MGRQLIYVAILGMACMMLGVKATNHTTISPANTTTVAVTSNTTASNTTTSNNTISSVTATSNTTALNSTALNSTALNSTALNSTALNSTALNSTALNSTALNSTALNSTASNTTALNSTALNTTALNTTASSVTANTGTTLVTKDNCKKDRACFSTPASCDPSTSNLCFFISTRASGNNLTFEISGESSGYIGVGLFPKNKGNDVTIYACANNNGTVKFIRSTLNNNTQNQDNTFSPGSVSGSVKELKIQCIFTAPGLSSNTRDANTPSFLSFLTGNFTNGTLGFPTFQLTTDAAVDLTNVNSSDVTPTTAPATSTTKGGSNTLQHAASQATVVILSGILAVFLL